MRLRKESFALGFLVVVLWSWTGVSQATACSPLPEASSPGFLEHLTGYMNEQCYRIANWPHDAQVRTSDGVHPFVQVWYSPSLFNWMTVLNRKGPVPDGAAIVKEQYQTQTAPLTEWTVMVKDSDVSWDGWYWAELRNPSPKNPNAIPTPGPDGCAEPQVRFNGAGLYCLNCHASAIHNQGTYASTTYMNPPPNAGSASRASSALSNNYDMHQRPSDTESSSSPPENDASGSYAGLVPSSIFDNLRPLQQVPVPCMVTEALDHVVARGKSHGGPQEFVTSDQCSGCHDATGTLAEMIPNMIFTAEDSSVTNLSQYGEWRYSMMGLAGRDPVFFAQLDTESTLHNHLDGKPNATAFVQDLCLRCHGVMGQRQYHIDNPDELFTRDLLQDPNSKYGALGRDGVSCAVCHHMSGNAFDPLTYTGRFNVGPPDELYGPYHSQQALPMQNAVGMIPTFSRSFGRDGITGATTPLPCASCHAIELPVYDRNGRQKLDEHGKPKTEFEQTTFFEWVDSRFVVPPISGGHPCQDCHMPTKYRGESLEFKIANIEDNTFPRVPETGPSTRLPDDLLTMSKESPYGRHQLNGINLFVLEMFDQFRKDLGLFKVDPNLPGSIRDKISSQKTAVAEGTLLAQTSTAKVEVTSVSTDAFTLTANVLVNNLAGHNFPTGVSFRRAFVNFQVMDAGGQVLWASGNTNNQGVIVDNSGTPLETEFFSPTQKKFQPHFWQNNPITSDNQVQIYEELVTDPQGLLTTSFLSLDHKVKDNRLQPEGRFSNEREIIAPVGIGGDPAYQSGCGCNTVGYQIPLAQIPGVPAAVQATIYYQSIPPYYLRQRAEEGNGPDTARLINFASHLNVNNYPEIASWKLQIATSGPIPIK